MRPLLLIVLGVGGVAFGLVAGFVGGMWNEPIIVPVADLAVGSSLIWSGVVAMLRRPGQPAGQRLALAGYAWFIGSVTTSDDLLPRIIGSTFQGYHEPILALLVLSFPARYPKDRFVRWVVVAGFAIAIAKTVFYLTYRIATDVLAFDPVESIFQLILWLDTVRFVYPVIPAAAALVLLRAATGPRRRLVQPVLLGGAISLFAGASGAYFPLLRMGVVQPLPEVAFLAIAWSVSALRVLAPIGIYVGIVRLREGRAAIGEAFVDVAGTPTPDRLQAALGHALGDPSLRVFGWDRDTSGYVAGDGATLSEDDARADDVSVTYLSHNDEPIAAVLHDRSLLEEPGLIAALSATVKLTVQNEQLERDVDRQLEEVRASRVRIVEAGDRERQRIERDLHDGIQQRLVAMSLRLRRTADGIAEQDAGVADDLRMLEAEAAAILDEARELARGIHPGVLTDVGLEGALLALAGRSPVPVDVDIKLGGRLPPQVESTGYFVASEALANVAKHSHATRARVRATVEQGRLVIEVNDDGVGGAVLDGGSGLRGLADRLATVNGTLTVQSAAAAGTHLTAVIPCELS